MLFYCIYPTKRHTRCLQLALKYQADVNNVSKLGAHVFQLMCEKAQECTPMCLIMLDGGADPNATNQVKNWMGGHNTEVLWELSQEYVGTDS